MLANPLPFPDHLPPGYSAVEESIAFDSSVHLQLEWPERIYTLKEFGYAQQEIDSCASPVAITTPFRLLSDAGVQDFL